MALNTFKCNYLTPLHFKGLNYEKSEVYETYTLHLSGSYSFVVWRKLCRCLVYCTVHCGLLIQYHIYMFLTHLADILWLPTLSFLLLCGSIHRILTVVVA